MLEEAELGSQVVLEGAVKVQVFWGDVREYPEGEAAPVHSPLHETVRRGLQNNGLNALPVHLRQQSLELHRLRRRERGGVFPARVAIADRANYADFAPHPEDRLQKVRDTGLAVRAHYANELHLLARVTVQI